MLYSYVVARDYGFAPNPFHGICTLATCKPVIRRVAQTGDWVVGTGTAKHGLSDRLVFVMQVSQTPTFEQYWADERYLAKRPALNGSMKFAYGDNIYHKDATDGRWLQEPSHHSLPNGRPNVANIKHDTQTNRVIIGERYAYWGRSGPVIPQSFRGRGLRDICAVRGQKNRFAEEFVERFVDWYISLGVTGYAGEPAEW